jgi:L-fucose isomerase
MKNSRLIGGKPKIGIRPIIDGRRGGIRESLEDMTMTMAQSSRTLFFGVVS